VREGQFIASIWVGARNSVQLHLNTDVSKSS
jgi:hypothetical protein